MCRDDIIFYSAAVHMGGAYNIYNITYIYIYAEQTSSYKLSCALRCSVNINLLWRAPSQSASARRRTEKVIGKKYETDGRVYYIVIYIYIAYIYNTQARVSTSAEVVRASAAVEPSLAYLYYRYDVIATCVHCIACAVEFCNHSPPPS